MNTRTKEKLIYGGTALTVLTAVYAMGQSYYTGEYEEAVSGELFTQFTLNGLDDASVDTAMSWKPGNHGSVESVTLRGIGDCAVRIYADPPVDSGADWRLVSDWDGPLAKIVYRDKYVPWELKEAAMQGEQIPFVREENNIPVPEDFVPLPQGMNLMEDIVATQCENPDDIITP